MRASAQMRQCELPVWIGTMFKIFYVLALKEQRDGHGLTSKQVKNLKISLVCCDCVLIGES